MNVTILEQAALELERHAVSAGALASQLRTFFSAPAAARADAAPPAAPNPELRAHHAAPQTSDGRPRPERTLTRDMVAAAIAARNGVTRAQLAIVLGAPLHKLDNHVCNLKALGRVRSEGGLYFANSPAPVEAPKVDPPAPVVEVPPAKSEPPLPRHGASLNARILSAIAILRGGTPTEIATHVGARINHVQAEIKVLEDEGQITKGKDGKYRRVPAGVSAAV